jgi:hypothetical protein
VFRLGSMAPDAEVSAEPWLEFDASAGIQAVDWRPPASRGEAWRPELLLATGDRRVRLLPIPDEAELLAAARRATRDIILR